MWWKYSPEGAMAGIRQKICVTLFPLWSYKKQWWVILIWNNRKHEKLKNRGWYSKCNWYFIKATTTADNSDGNTPASTVTATATTKNNHNCNNCNNNNVIMIKIITAIKMKSACALK